MIRQRQLPSQIYNTEPVSMQMDRLQGKCAIPTSHKPTIMCYSPICQKLPDIKEKFSLVIFKMPHTYVPIAVTSNLWIISSKPLI